MYLDRTVSAEPIRYTAATVEMMRLEDLQHIRCAVNYESDKSPALFPESRYLSTKRWIENDQKRYEEAEAFEKRSPERYRQEMQDKASKALFPPFFSDGHIFYGHKETSNMSYVSRRGKHKQELRGIEIVGSRPCFSKHPVIRNRIRDEYQRQMKELNHEGSFSPRSLRYRGPYGGRTGKMRWGENLKRSSGNGNNKNNSTNNHSKYTESELATEELLYVTPKCNDRHLHDKFVKTKKNRDDNNDKTLGIYEDDGDFDDSDEGIDSNRLSREWFGSLKQNQKMRPQSSRPGLIKNQSQNQNQGQMRPTSSTGTRNPKNSGGQNGQSDQNINALEILNNNSAGGSSSSTAGPTSTRPRSAHPRMMGSNNNNLTNLMSNPKFNNINNGNHNGPLSIQGNGYAASSSATNASCLTDAATALLKANLKQTELLKKDLTKLIEAGSNGNSNSRPSSGNNNNMNKQAYNRSMIKLAESAKKKMQDLAKNHHPNNGTNTNEIGGAYSTLMPPQNVNPNRSPQDQDPNYHNCKIGTKKSDSNQTTNGQFGKCTKPKQYDHIVGTMNTRSKSAKQIIQCRDCVQKKNSNGGAGLAAKGGSGGGGEMFLSERDIQRCVDRVTERIKELNSNASSSRAPSHSGKISRPKSGRV